MEKRPLIAGNWKMHKTRIDAVSFIKELAPKVTQFDALIYLSVPFTAIGKSAEASIDTKLIIGAQNMHEAIKGAYTGEISALMLKEAGAEFVLLGHSERRSIYNESDELINRKLKRAIEEDIQPILCIGESLEQRENNETENILKQQLEKNLKDISENDLSNLIIAYEPVWAIGTGKTATSDIAQQAHHFIRKTIAKMYNGNIADKMYLLYGGSVKADNVNELINQKDIDGVLVGGAALDSNSFYEVIKNSKGN